MRRCLMVLLILAAGCGRSRGPEGATPPARRLRLATTTSFDNSRLIEVLFPPFEKRYGIRVDVIAVGTGKALELARNGDVDVVIVHYPKGEEEFVRDGYGVNRRRFMHNDFLILGPRSDPAGVRAARSAAAAMAAIASAQSVFISRGDSSGTHRKEQELWQAAGLRPGGEWYLETGQGMGASLMIADHKQAYILADRGTYLAFKDKITLAALFEGDPALYNPYSIVAVNPARWRNVNYSDAMLLVAWVTSREGQQIIARFRKGGERLFIPDAVPQDASR